MGNHAQGGDAYQQADTANKTPVHPEYLKEPSSEN
jgi:hypothetical protein